MRMRMRIRMRTIPRGERDTHPLGIVHMHIEPTEPVAVVRTSFVV